VLSVRENVEFPLLIGAGSRPEPDQRWIDHLVESVDLADWRAHKPNELSGGQRQRVASTMPLCRAFLTSRTSCRTLAREVVMTVLNASEARANLYRLIDQTNESHEPITIAGKRYSAVLVSGDDWRAIQETLHLLSLPGMRESIRDGLATPVEECHPESGW
jgi:prevent-host-death family protein